MRQADEPGSVALFSRKALYDITEGNLQSMKQLVEKMDDNQLLNTPLADLIKYLIAKFDLVAPTLNTPDWCMTPSETQVDVRFDQRRYITDTSRPCLVPGQRFVIEVPFVGDAELFDARANTYSSPPPRAAIRGQTLFLTYEVAHDSEPRDINKEATGELDDIVKHLGWVRCDLDIFRKALSSQAEQSVMARRTRLSENQLRAGALGIPLKKRTDALPTYVAPEVRRKITPLTPPFSSAPNQPEPILDDDNYDFILNVMQNMTIVMERSPSAFHSMGEEDLRQHFLVQLNGQYEGQATGETFNFNGKTDILVRSNGKNIFIAECKFWKGAKAFQATIDQLLSYTAWRDTKTAILVFNRGTAMSTVIDAIKMETPLHNNFKRRVDWPHESGFRYVFKRSDDPNREIILTVLIFEIPSAPTT